MFEALKECPSLSHQFQGSSDAPPLAQDTVAPPHQLLEEGGQHRRRRVRPNRKERYYQAVFHRKQLQDWADEQAE